MLCLFIFGPLLLVCLDLSLVDPFRAALTIQAWQFFVRLLPFDNVERSAKKSGPAQKEGYEYGCRGKACNVGSPIGIALIKHQEPKAALPCFREPRTPQFSAPPLNFFGQHYLAHHTIVTVLTFLACLSIDSG
jgi:hypothetical protein